MRKLDAIIRVRMLLCESSMLLFVSVCCYAKARCYYSCSYAVMRNLDAIIRVRMLLCKTSMLLFVFRIMLVLIRVFRELDRYGLARVINYLCLFFPLKENLYYSQRLRGNCLGTFRTTCLAKLGF